jgi:hypothetical protein
LGVEGMDEKKQEIFNLTFHNELNHGDLFIMRGAGFKLVKFVSHCNDFILFNDISTNRAVTIKKNPISFTSFRFESVFNEEVTLSIAESGKVFKTLIRPLKVGDNFCTDAYPDLTLEVLYVGKKNVVWRYNERDDEYAETFEKFKKTLIGLQYKLIEEKSKFHENLSHYSQKQKRSKFSGI